ncbi:MAG: energy transducer TonB [Rhodospirillales bacterium]
MMTLGPRHWTFALIGAVTAHAALVGLFWEPAPSGAKSAGLGGIEISLGVAGSAPGEKSPTPPQKEQKEAVEKRDEPPPEVPAVETAEVPPEPIIRPVIEPEPEPIKPEPVKKVVEKKTEKVKAPPIPKPKRKPKPKPPEKAIERPKPEPVRAAPKPLPDPKKIETAQAPSATPGAGGKSGVTEQVDTGSGQATASGGMPGSAADYLSLLQAWLEKHKEYPRSAQSRREEGVALLWFVIDRNGHVLQYKIRRPSGFASLDREVEAMIRHAQPLPRMPDDMTKNRLEIVVPVQFRIR